jgi:hypothetical protein
MRILSTIGAALDLALYLATRRGSLFVFRLKEPNAAADRYINGRGTSFGLEDQKPRLKPQSSSLRLFFPVGSSSLPPR